MVMIDDKEYDESTLPEAARLNLARVMTLRNEIMELSLVTEEWTTSASSAIDAVSAMPCRAVPRTPSLRSSWMSI